MTSNADDIEKPSVNVAYAQALPWHRRKRLRRRMVATAVLAALTWLGLQWGPEIYEHARHLYWQRQCLQWSMAPETVVYEEDADRATALLNSARGYPPIRQGLVPPDSGFFTSPRVALYRAECVDRLLPDTSADWDGIAFTHERISPTGHKRLIIVRLGLGRSYVSGFHLLIEQPTVIIPATSSSFRMASLPSRVPSWPLDIEPYWVQESQIILPRFRLFAGQADPADSSHFTLPYEARLTYSTEDAWQRGSFHGWLLDDDTVDFRVDGPLSLKFPGMPTLDSLPKRR